MNLPRAALQALQIKAITQVHNASDTNELAQAAQKATKAASDRHLAAGHTIVVAMAMLALSVAGAATAGAAAPNRHRPAKTAVADAATSVRAIEAGAVVNMGFLLLDWSLRTIRASMPSAMQRSCQVLRNSEM